MRPLRKHWEATRYERDFFWSEDDDRPWAIAGIYSGDPGEWRWTVRILGQGIKIAVDAKGVAFTDYDARAAAERAVDRIREKRNASAEKRRAAAKRRASMHRLAKKR